MIARYSLFAVRLSLIALIFIFTIQISFSEEIDVSDKLISTNPKYFAVNELEEQFRENEKISVIILAKNQNTIKKFNFKSNAVAFGASSFSKEDFKVKNKFSTISAFSAEISKEAYENLKANSDLQIEYDYPMQAFLQDSTRLVNATRTWAAISNGLNITGKGQAICILDTGLNYSHADLGSCSASDFSNGNCAKAPSGWDFVNSDADPYDDNGHGTHVAGIAAASGGIRGVAPDAKIIPIKVLDGNGDGNESNIISGVDWCVSNATKFNITVISMSLGTKPPFIYSDYCDSDYTTFSTAIASAIAKNITVVAATGNSGSSTQIASPACIQNTTAAGATTKTDALATGYSNRNNITDLLAPGSNVNSTLYGGGYGQETGTSMAAPHVAGAIALLQQFASLELGRNFAANETQTYLQDNGKTISENGINYKRIDVIQTLISFDTKAPSLVLNTPANGSVIVAGQLVTFNISENILLSTIWYNTNNKANTTAGSSINTSGWPAGNVTLAIFVNDSAGNLNWSAYLFTTNNTAPTASNVILSPATAYTNDTLRCNYTYSDANNDAENGTLIQWFANGVANATLENLTTAGASFTEKNQAWMCSVTPKDGSDYGAQANSSNITIQNFPLIINYTTLSAGKFSGSITINATVFDIDTNDVDVMNFYYLNATQTTFIANDTSVPYSINLNTSAVGDGNYTILINATDGDANANRTVADIFVDNALQAPIVSVTSPNGGESLSGTQTITWTASDPDYDVLSFIVYYSANAGTNWTLLGSATETSFSWNTATVSNGANYRIRINATDNTFNVSDTSDASFTINNAADNSGGGSGGGDAGVGAGSGKPDPNRASFIFPEVKKGSTQSLSVSGKSAIPISEIEFTAADDAVNAKVIVKKVDSATGKPASEVYSYVEIETENLANKISSAKINFRIDDGWLKTNGIDKNSIALYRYAGSWQKLDTTLIANDGIYARYTAKSPGFSTFAIAGEKLQAQTSFAAQEKKEEKAEEQKKKGESAAQVTGSAAFAGAFTKSSAAFAVIVVLLLAIPLVVSFKFGLFKKKKSKPVNPYQAYQNYYAEYQRRYMLWYKRAAKARSMGAPKPIAAKRKLNLGGMREKLKGITKWLFTDTKLAKELEKQEKSKGKERPDFGFG